MLFRSLVLLHCFAGCDAAQILAAAGLDLRDLYPPRLNDPNYHGGRPKAPRIPWRDVCTAILHDLAVCSLAFCDLAKGRQFSPEDAAQIAKKAADLADQVREVRNER